MCWLSLIVIVVVVAVGLHSISYKLLPSSIGERWCWCVFVVAYWCSVVFTDAYLCVCQVLGDHSCSWIFMDLQPCVYSVVYLLFVVCHSFSHRRIFMLIDVQIFWSFRAVWHRAGPWFVVWLVGPHHGVTLGLQEIGLRDNPRHKFEQHLASASRLLAGYWSSPEARLFLYVIMWFLYEPICFYMILFDFMLFFICYVVLGGLPPKTPPISRPPASPTMDLLSAC